MDGELILVLWTALVFIGAIIGVIGVRMLMRSLKERRESGNAGNANGKLLTAVILTVIGAAVFVIFGGLLLFMLLY